MADVTGRIGGEDVVLNNAATEATLKLLLQATMAANKQSLSTIQNLAQKSGLSPEAVQAANSALNQTQAAGSKVGKAFEALGFVAGALSSTFREAANLGEKIASGTSQASDVFNSFSKISGPVGVVAGLFQKMSQFQQDQLANYQELSKVGISFGGSLTDLRMQASLTYMTMGEFNNVVKTNGETFARMGITANEGAKAFVRLSNELLKSQAGTNLQALGYTTQEVNQGMLNYISMTGGRTRQEMQDQKALTAGTVTYLQELDQLAQITGKNRQEMEKKLQEEMNEAEFQLFLGSKSREEREAIEQNVKRATALYGKGGADIAKANAMGVATQGEAGKKLEAVSSDTAEAVRRDLELRKQYGADSKQVQDNEIAGRKANAKSMGELAGPVGYYSGILKDNGDAVKQANKDRLLADGEIEEQYSKQAKEREEREKSQAKSAVETKKALDELGQEILAATLPVIEAFSPLIKTFITGLTGLLTPVAKLAQAITQSEVLMGVLKTAVIGLTAVFVAAKVAQLGKTVATGVGNIFKSGTNIASGAIEGFKKGGIKGALAGGLSAGVGEATGALAGPLGSTPQNPMYVSIVSGGAGGGVFDQLIDKLGPKGGGGSKIGDLAGKIGEKLSGGPGGSLVEKIAGKVGGSQGLSKILGGAGSLLGKVAAPLAIGMTAYDAFKGFTADKNASFGDKMMNAGSSALNGLTFGLLGSSPEEIAAKATKSKEKEEVSESTQSEKEKSANQQSIESLAEEISDLNKIMTELLKHTKDMAEYSRRTSDGVKSLNPNLFPS